VPWATVNITNTFASAVEVTVNGVQYSLAVGQRLLEQHVTPAPSGNDVIQVTDLAIAGCGVGTARGYFVANQWYQLNITTGPGTCSGNPGPGFTVQDVLPTTG
jgi:hypothetical protein